MSGCPLLVMAHVMSDSYIKIKACILLSSFVPQSRRAHNIELKGAVVIFDEAHNVVSLCPALW